MAEKKNLSLRDKIIACNDIEERIIAVKQWDNVKLLIRGLTGAERDNAMKEAIDKKGNLDSDKFNMLLIIARVRDPETGKPVFNSGDIESLGNKAVGALEILTRTAMELSGIGEDIEKDISKN